MAANASSVAYHIANKDAADTHVPQMVSTQYASESSAADKGKAKGYWGTEWEKFARAFETWVSDALKAREQANTFLSDGGSRADSTAEQRMPYPRGSEREVMGKAFDALFAEFKTREDDAGNVALFNASDDGYTAPDGTEFATDTSPHGARNIRLLEGGVGRGADAVHPYVARSLPADAPLGHIASAFGGSVQWFDLRVDLGAAERRKFGFFNGANLKGTIYLRASGNDRPHLSVLGHEAAHRLKAERPDLYTKLIDAITPFVDVGRYEAEFKKSAVARDVKADEGVQEEFIGEVLSDGFMDHGFWRALGEKNPNLLSRVAKFIGKLIDGIKAKVGHSKRTERYLTDYDRVMQLAGEVMAEFDTASNGPVPSRGGEDDAGNVAMFSRQDGGYTAPDGSSVDPDPEARGRVDALTRGVAKDGRGTGADQVLPYEPRRPVGSDALRAIADAIGARVQWFGLRADLLAEQRQQFGWFNGAYHNGTLFLRADGNDQPHLSILGHEAAHQFAKDQPALYAELVEAVRPYVDAQRYGTEFAQSAVARDLKDHAKIREEFVGEILSDGFMDPGFWKAVGDANLTLLRRLGALVSELIDRIKASTGYTKRTERYLTDYNRVMQIAGEAFGRYGLTMPTANVALFSRAANTPEANALRAISENDDLFKLAKSTATTVEAIAADIDPEIKVKVDPKSGSKTLYTLTMPDGAKATLTVREPNRYGPDVYAFDLKDGEMVNQVLERPGENPEDVADGTEDVWIDVSKLREGGAGTRVYAIASAFAHNTDRIFIGDPAGLSNEAMRRRPEQMLSSALKFGTTAHLAPHPRQIGGDKALGVPPLKWVYGDDQANILALIDTNVRALENAFPAFNKIDFDVSTVEFRNAESGSVILRQNLGRRIARLRSQGDRALGVARAGGETVARGAVLRALLREAGRAGATGGQRAGLLDRLARLGDDAPEATRKVFYKRGGASSGIDLGLATQLAQAFEDAGLNRVNVAATAAVLRLRNAPVCAVIG